MTAGQQNLAQPLIFRPFVKDFALGTVDVDVVLTSPLQGGWGFSGIRRQDLTWSLPAVAIPEATGVVDFTLHASADLLDDGHWAQLTLNGQPLGDHFKFSGQECPNPPQQTGLTMTAESFNAVLAIANGRLNIVITPRGIGIGNLPQVGVCLGLSPSTMQLTIAYTGKEDVGDPDDPSFVKWQVMHDTIVNNFDEHGVKHRDLELDLSYDPHTNGLVTEIVDELGKTTIGGCEGVVIIDADGDEMVVTTFATTAEIGGEVWTFSHSAGCILVPG